MTERDLRAILSRNIRTFRKYRNLSQAQFAELIDISIPFLSDIENGKKWISPTTLAKMADALNIEAYELLRPAAIVPDNAAAILEKYTAEIYCEFGKMINNIHETYVQQLNKKKA